MFLQIRTLVAVAGMLLGADRTLVAGGIHVRYPADAPEDLAGRNEIYEQGVLNLDHRHAGWFEQTHPFYAKMFNDPTMLNKLLDRWEAHEERFEYWHDCLWKVLDGYAATHEGSRLQAEYVSPPLSSTFHPAGTNEPGIANPRANAGRGAPVPRAQGIPEPSTGALMISGLIAAMIWTGAQRIGRRRSREARGRSMSSTLASGPAEVQSDVRPLGWVGAGR